ncbi:MAG: hypothetical protein B6D77_08480 [gamma proteobacterium symbiont of Ctena orbiculata]|nr:MAG: hypothetical protein B6D77_08480 [gamma proteobacterium symbiont of Ctena orbiculata]
MKEMEQFITCNFFEMNKSGEAFKQIEEFKQQGLVEPIRNTRGFQFRVVGELDLLGLQPAYIGHVHGEHIGPFARFDEDYKAVVSSIEARDIKLVKQVSKSGHILYLGEKQGYWRLIVIPIPLDILQQERSPLPSSSVDSTLVQCIYQGP